MGILANKYVFQPFWAHHNGVSGFENWEDLLERDREKVDRAYLLWNTKEHTDVTLDILSSHLYVLRNQLIHGGATWTGSMNRDQVAAGAQNMNILIPLFTELMMDNPHTEPRARRCYLWWERAEPAAKMLRSSSTGSRSMPPTQGPEKKTTTDRHPK